MDLKMKKRKIIFTNYDVERLSTVQLLMCGDENERQEATGFYFVYGKPANACTCVCVTHATVSVYFYCAQKTCVYVCVFGFDK